MVEAKVRGAISHNLTCHNVRRHDLVSTRNPKSTCSQSRKTFPVITLSIKTETIEDVTWTRRRLLLWF